MAAKTRGLPINAAGYARGGPQDVLDNMPEPSGHHFASEGPSGEDATCVQFRVESHDTEGRYHSGFSGLVVVVADTGSTNPTGTVSLLRVEGGANLGNAIGHYVSALFGPDADGDVSVLDSIYVDDAYNLQGGLTGVVANVDRCRGLFVESQDNAHARKVYAINTRQVTADGLLRWGIAATGNAPNFFGGTLQIVLDHSLGFNDLTDPPAPIATNALECGTEASPRNAYITKTGDVVINDAARGTIKKSANGHYWRETVDNTGARVATDLGTTPP